MGSGVGREDTGGTGTTLAGFPASGPATSFGGFVVVGFVGISATGTATGGSGVGTGIGRRLSVVEAPGDGEAVPAEGAGGAPRSGNPPVTSFFSPPARATGVPPADLPSGLRSAGRTVIFSLGAGAGAVRQGRYGGPGSGPARPAAASCRDRTQPWLGLGGRPWDWRKVHLGGLLLDSRRGRRHRVDGYCRPGRREALGLGHYPSPEARRGIHGRRRLRNFRGRLDRSFDWRQRYFRGVRVTWLYLAGRLQPGLATRQGGKAFNGRAALLPVVAQAV